ncbi:MAG TPA: ribosome-associated translation inhibitor RaiA [Candidatus Paceibacterota bacterium]|nr:ribosome-associated translation inhibitor RaiA [Candidatus Paceibacterota bacterium]
MPKNRLYWGIMQIDIRTQNLELNGPLRTFIEEKMRDIERLLGDVGPVHARIEVGIPSAHHQTGPIYYAEANIDINGTLLRAESKNYDMHAAIVDVKEELKILVKKFKERLTEKERKPTEA